MALTEIEMKKYELRAMLVRRSADKLKINAPISTAHYLDARIDELIDAIFIPSTATN